MVTTIRRTVAVARRIVAATVLVVVLALGLSVAIPTVLGYETYAITTGSMGDTAPPGTLVVSEAVAVDELTVGDVITYVPPADSGIDHLVTHRLTEIEVDELGFTVMRTKGDANASDDPWTFVLDQATQPRMVATVPVVGWAVLALADRTVRMIAIGIPAGAIFLLAARDAVRVVRHEDAGSESSEVPERTVAAAADEREPVTAALS